HDLALIDRGGDAVMKDFERDQHDRDLLRPHVAAAIAEGLIDLPAGEDVDSVLSGIKFIRGVPTGPTAAAPVMRTARCMLCSCSFQTGDRHAVCWPCRADARAGVSS